MGNIMKQQREAQVQHIFRLMLQNKSQEEIARELNISTKTVQRYGMEIDRRYGEMQRQKTENTIFTEAQLFKNRMLTLYRGLENIVVSFDRHVSGMERARCAEIAANIAIDVLKMESEGIKAIREINSIVNNTNERKGHKILGDIQSRFGHNDGDNSDNGSGDTVNQLVSERMDDPEKSC